MAENFPGLIQKGQMFYFRLAIPRKFWDIARCKEISSSLNTTNYQEAVFKWKTEFTHLQKFINVFEEIIMRINVDGKLVLGEPDVDKVLLYRLGQIQHFLEENFTEIERGDKGVKNIQLYDPKDKGTDKVRDLMANVIISYLRDLVETNQANATLRTTYSKLKSKEIELGLLDKNKNDTEWFKSFSGHMHSLEKYTAHAVKHIKEDTSYKPTNPKVVSLLQTYDAVKSVERITTPMTRTHWKKFFKRFAINKQNRKSTSDLRIYQNQTDIMLFFGLIKKQFVEEITKHDIRSFCEIVYQVPKRWHEKIKEEEEIHGILTKNRNKALGKERIQEIIFTVKEFLRFAVKEDVLLSSLTDYFDSPMYVKREHRDSFETNELRKIFNPDTYPTPKDRRNSGRFWVPLIALYQGFRISEASQLDVKDIVIKNKIPCFSINGNSPDKSVKNSDSNRIVPIHPQLIKMGFMLFVEYRSRDGKQKLFFDTVEKKSGIYKKSIGNWFGRYLDQIGIKDAKKVFHSFRHTFMTKAIEKRMLTEYQNALGGWADQGIGQKVYGRKKEIRVMLEELSKVTYPIQKELRELEREFKGSYVINLLHHP